jgi:carbamoyltransferase
MEDDHILCAAEEERFSRKKHDSGFPERSAKWCLDYAGISAKDLDYVGFYDKPVRKFHRILQTYVATAPRGVDSFVRVLPVWLREKLWTPELIRDTLDYEGDIFFLEHHMSHAASAFFSSPFKEAAILTADGVGEWTTTSLGTGVDNRVQIKHEIYFPHSLGLLYNAFTYYLGFTVNSDEYKVMGASSYGKPAYYDLMMKELIDVKDDGSYRLNMKYFTYTHDVKMVNEKFEQLFGYPRRQPKDEFQRHHFEIAMSIQKLTEEVLLRMANFLYKETHLKNLCMGGGLGLNCVANARIRKETPFRNLFIQPAAGDSGGAMGAASYIYYTWLGNKRRESIVNDQTTLLHGNEPRVSVRPIMTDAYLGPEFSDAVIQDYLTMSHAVYHECNRQSLLQTVANHIAEGHVVGWFQGRMEWGPRALGNRSILADPRDPTMKDTVNEKVKKRERFRPFAPTVLLDRTSEYFDIDCPSPYMLLVAQVKKQNVPAITHVDGSARLQTIAREDNPLYYDLIAEFYRITGVPLVLNTSYNMAGEPIVCSPQDAFKTFMNTQIDLLAIGRFTLAKEEQNLKGEREGVGREQIGVTAAHE